MAFEASAAALGNLVFGECLPGSVRPASLPWRASEDAFWLKAGSMGSYRSWHWTAIKGTQADVR
jgi:hypothetical protein